MGATNKTTYYELPIFASTDSPKWLVDWPDAMGKIDSAIHQIALQSGTSATDISNLQSSLESLSGTVTSQGTQITSLAGNITALQGTVNTITALIGNGEPTTTDKTIIGAINEIYAMIGGGTELEADNVTYDNTASGMTATNVQDAIDELVSAIPTATSEVQTGTLTAGQTSVTLTFVKTIGATSRISVFDSLDVPYSSYTTTTNSITLVFEAQASDMVVSVEING